MKKNKQDCPDAVRICYLQLDHPELSGQSIGELLETYRAVHRIPNREKIYLFLDEVSYSPQWTRWVKALHDMNNAEITVSFPPP